MTKVTKFPIAAVIGCIVLCTQARADMYSFTNGSINTLIPDDGSSLSSQQVVSGQLPVVQDLTVYLDISGGFNGDLYAYLRLEGSGIGFSVLLNRSGVTAENPIGYQDAGVNIVLADSASIDIHSYGGNGGSQLTGTWQPDARGVSPFVVTDASARDDYLSGFDGLDPNGTWTLVLTDVVNGNPQSTLVSWGLQVTTIPEPTSMALAALGALVVGFEFRRRHQERR